MSPPTQANRLIAIDTPLGPDVLLLQGFTGQESISRLFSFELDLLSTDPEIKFEDIIGQKMTIRVRLGKEKERFFHGIISRFMQTGSDVGLANYRATMVPALWFLTRTADCRIFQNKKVPEIIQEILKENGVTDIKTVLKATYEPRDYCVQYRETDFNFVSRLMEQYGIFYFFAHEEKKHTLVLSDDLSAHQPCPEQSKVSWNPQGSDNLDEDVISSLQWEETFRFGKYAVTDYNFETPNTSLRAEVKTQIDVGGNSKYEIYDYPGEYGKKAEGDGIAKIRMQEEEAQYKVISGNGTARVFTTGYKFTLQDYVRKDVNGDYVLTQVQHVASVGSAYTSGAAGGGNEGDYSNSFTCIPAKRPFRPPQVTPKPMVQGPQTAVVVGKSGEEIWTDKYGRVKVQFHWDRYGTMNESSSCWLRVSQVHAGKGFGGVDIPRIGEEVIVSFLEGDPDFPIIVGRVYNGQNMPPGGLPGAGMTSGLKSNSTPGGGGNNSIMMNDTKGNELYSMNAQFNCTENVGNNRTTTIGVNDSLSVGADRSESVGSNETISVGSNQNITIGADQTISVGANQTETIGSSCSQSVGATKTETISIAKALTIGAGYQVTVGAGMNETIGGAKAEEIGGAKVVMVGAASAELVGGIKTVKAGGSMSHSAGASLSEKAGANISSTAGGKINLSAGGNFDASSGGKAVVKATSELSLKCGGAAIVLSSGGEITISGTSITIKGSTIKINSSGEVGIKGSVIKEQ